MRAKGFFATVDLRLRKGDWIAEGTGVDKEIVGQVVKFKIEKNKTYKRMQTGEFDFYYAENAGGIPIGHNDNVKEALLLAVQYGIIEKAGAWYYIGDKKYNGKEKLIVGIKEDPKLVKELEKKVLELATNPLIT